MEIKILYKVLAERQKQKENEYPRTAGISQKNPERPGTTHKEIQTSGVQLKRSCFKKDCTVRKTRKEKRKLKFSFSNFDFLR